MSTNEREIGAILHVNEQSLLDPAVRRDRNRVLELLSEDFVEFGASGRVWTRGQIVELLATEESQPPAMEAFQCSVLAPTVALVTYRTVRTDAQNGMRADVLRSSIWMEQDGKWKVRFHQGTTAALDCPPAKTPGSNS